MARNPKILPDLTTTTAPAPRPHSLGAAAVEEETVVEKKRRATHGYVDDDGADIDNEEDARGIVYALLGHDTPFVWKWKDATEAERIMLAIFGAKTLATNEASAVRSNDKLSDAEKSPAAQMAGVTGRFALLRDGQWVDRTREPGVSRIDKPLLATAVCNAKVAAKKATQADVDGGLYAETLQKLTDDPTYVRKVRSVPEVQIEFSRLAASKATVGIDDI